MKLLQNHLKYCVHLYSKCSTIHKLLLWMCIPCFYIFLAGIFDYIRIPYSLLNAEATKNFNAMIEALAVSYITAVFVYILTVLFVKYRTRRMRLFELYDLFQQLQKEKNSIEGHFSVRCELISIDEFLEQYDADINNKFINNISFWLDKIRIYETILLENECDILADIRKMMDLKAPNDMMTQKEKVDNLKQFLAICENIERLNNNIIGEVKLI